MAKCYLWIILFTLLACTASAQETTSEIAGIVVSNEGPSSNATVTAVHLPTGTIYSTTTRKDGRYNLPNLKVGGPYTITVTFVGYKEEKQENIILILGEEFKADFILDVDYKLLQGLTVNAQSHDKVFNYNRTGSQEIINRLQLERLPTFSRSLKDFARLIPSASGMSLGGRNGLYNSVTIDGVNFNNVVSISSSQGKQIPGPPISLETIEQVQVNITPYDVRMGGFTGSSINSVTRSGTNNMQGAIYSYFNGADAMGYKAGNTTLPKTDFSYLMKGFYVSGPIVKNKLFFFLSAEREVTLYPVADFTASDAMHAPDNTVSFANADTLNRLREFLINKYNYDPGEFQDYSYKTQRDILSAKIDWTINSKNSFTLKYNFLNSSRENPAGNTGAPNGYRQPGITGLPFKGSGFSSNLSFNIFMAELNTRIGNHASNKLQVGYASLKNYRKSLAATAFPFVDIMNGQGESYTAFGYENLSYNNILYNNIYQLFDFFTLYKGKHEISFGTQNYIKLFKTGFAPNFLGAFRFNTLTDFYNSANNGDANARNYTLQYSLNKDGSFPFGEISSTELGFFIQDKWRVKPTFIFTYGLRGDVPFLQNKFEANPYVSDLIFRDGKHYDVSEKPETNLLIAPRFGFNWDVTGRSNVQLRGGAGIFTGPPPFVWLSNQASNNGVQFGSYSTRRVAFSTDNSIYKPNTAEQSTSYNLVFIDKNFKYLQVFKTSLAADIKLPGDIIATVEATYIKDINAAYFQNVNLPSQGTAFSGSDTRIRYERSKIYSGVPVPTNTNPDIDNAILMTNSNKGYAYAFTFQLQKSIADLYFSAAYTFSTAKTLNDGGPMQASMWRDRPVKGDPNVDELGFANFYLPHRVIAYASYRKEYAKHFATSVGLIFEAAPSGVGSYTYRGDVNNDGTSSGNNDLVYIPKSQDDIVLVPVNAGGGIITDSRTPDQIWAQLNQFISQDKYLNSHRGEVAERNAVVYPFFKRLDINITQDFYLLSGKNKTKHTLRVTFDLVNAGNFLNKNWGLYKALSSGTVSNPDVATFLKYEGIAQNGPNQGKPLFSFPYLDAENQVTLTNSYKNDISILSRWQAQIGVRYIFN